MAKSGKQKESARRVERERRQKRLDILEGMRVWKIEASLEDNERYFYESPELEEIVQGRMAFIIGRKGTGKTAISQYLSRLSDYRTFTGKLSFKNFPFNELYSMEDSKYTHPNQYISLWKLLIYSSIARMMGTNTSLDTEIRRVLEKAYPTDPVISLKRSVDSWKSSEIELAAPGIPGSVKIGNKGPEKLDWVTREQVLEQVIIENIDDSYYYIIFDELDEDYNTVALGSDDARYVALLTSLFKAVLAIKGLFREERYNIVPIVLIRDDIFAILEDSDKMKWLDVSMELDWREDKIQEMLAFRIVRAGDPTGEPRRFSAVWSRLVLPVHENMNRSQKKTLLATRRELYDFISERTLRRPRDYIKYLQICADVTLRRKREYVSRSVVKEAENAYSYYLRGELVGEARSVLPEIERVMEIISHIRKDTFSLREFEDGYKYAANRGHVEGEVEPEDVLERLFHFGIVGNKTGGNTAFRIQHREARFNPREDIVVHRGLHQALQIKDSSASSEQTSDDPGMTSTEGSGTA